MYILFYMYRFLCTVVYVLFNIFYGVVGPNVMCSSYNAEKSVQSLPVSFDLILKVVLTLVSLAFISHSLLMLGTPVYDILPSVLMSHT